MSFFSKLLAFLVGLAVLAAAAAWIMGGESAKSSTRISIDASPGDVFRYLVRGEKIKQWADGVVSAGTFSGEDSAGPEARVVLDEGKEVVWQDSIMRFQTGESVSIQSRKSGLTRTYVFQLEENDLGGTNIQYRLTESASGLERFMFPFEDRENARNDMATEMTKLKALVESEVEAGSVSRSEEEEESPVVQSQTSGNNDSADQATAQTSATSSPGTSAIDQVLGPVYGNGRDKKPEDGKRNFESLFGTGG